MAASMTPDELGRVLDPGGTRPAPWWTALPEPGTDAGYTERQAYRQDVRRCWDLRMALVMDGMRASSRQTTTERAEGHGLHPGS